MAQQLKEKKKRIFDFIVLSHNSLIKTIKILDVSNIG